MPTDASPRTDFTRPASDIAVADFRLLFQWPLIWAPANGKAFDRDRLHRDLTREKWEHVPDPLKLLAEDPSYEEFIYFHDFTQDFLFPRGTRGKPTDESFRLYRREDIARLVAVLPDPAGGKAFDLTFVVDRLTLHVFDLGVAVMTLELRCEPAGPLTLAQCQTAIDRLRRSYVPFWTDGLGMAAGRVPLSVALNGEPGKAPPFRNEAVTCLSAPERDPQVFDHWRRMIAPLKLRGPEGGDWRDPSDERIPVNSFISLTPADIDAPQNAGRKDQVNRNALLQVKESDWYRLWDAEEAGSDYPYNPDFLKNVDATGFYDRFFPDPRCGGLASRHLFGGVHYGYLGSGEFTDTLVIKHWRRHYAQLSLIARLQVAVLLALSSRISGALHLLRSDRNAFDTEILQIQGDFLRYRHRYHFTGVSSQIQAAEMYDRWRQTLQIDALCRDVQDELATATTALHSNKQMALSEAANQLGTVAAVGVMGGLIVGGLGSNLFLGADNERALLGGVPETRQLVLIALLCWSFLTLGGALLSWIGFRRNWFALSGIVALVAAFGLYNL